MGAKACGKKVLVEMLLWSTVFFLKANVVHIHSTDDKVSALCVLMLMGQLERTKGSMGSIF